MKKTNETIEILTNSLSEGATRSKACELAGISLRTLYNWLKDVEVAEKIKQAEGIGMDYIKHLCIERIINAKQWQASAWWLERNYPEQFGKRDVTVESTVEIVDKSEQICTV